MTNILKNIEKLTENEGISITFLEKKIKASKGVLSRAINKNTDIQAKWIKGIAENYPQYNIEWLITGEGPMLKTQQPNQTIDTMETIETDQGLIMRNPLLKGPYKNEIATIQYYDVDFAAGRGIDILESGRPTYEMVIPGFVGCKAFNVYGDSMESLIKGGSIAFGRKLDHWHEYLEYGQIYGVVMNDGTRFLKYIRKSEDEKNKFLLRSENQNYDDFEIPKKRIHNVWLIEGWMLKRV